MASTLPEDTLISILESSTSLPIFSPFSDYLQPFSDLRNPKSNSRRPKPQDSYSHTLVRQLAKRFALFLQRCLSVLAKRLSNTLKPNGSPSPEGQSPPEFILELLRTYRLCLDCLELVSSELACKPYSLYLRSARLLSCMLDWGLYEEAKDVAFGVLERLRVLDFGAKKSGSKAGKLLPAVVQGGDDAVYARLVVEVAIAVVKCLALGQSAVDDDYRTVITLAEEVKPWFSVLDANTYHSKDIAMITYIDKCAQYLIGKFSNFNGGLVSAFCLMTLEWYARSSVKNQMFKFCRRTFSLLFRVHEDRPSATLGILMSILNFLACECKVATENWQVEFVDLVSYCANKCQRASAIFCSTVAGQLNDLADDLSQVTTPTVLFIRLYSTAMCFNNRVLNPRVVNAVSSTDEKKGPQPCCLFNDGAELSKMGPLLGSLKSCIYDDITPSSETPSSENHPPSQISLRAAGNSLITTQKTADAYRVAYLNLLKFLCQPLAELVNSQKKCILVEDNAAFVSSGLCRILEAFHQFCNISLSFHRENRKGQGSGDGCDFNEGDSVIAVSVAAFILAIRTKHDVHNTMNLIKQVISSDWIQPKGLKYMSSRFYYIGAFLYEQKQLNEASKALKLCCRAGWACLKIHCQNGILGAEDDILDSVNESCRQTVFLLDVLSQSESMKIHKLIVQSLENWSVAEDLSIKVQAPVPIVKHWVKIQCELSKSMGVDYRAPTLYCLLGSSARISIRSIGKLLQQELIVYERMENTYPEFSHEMLLKIIGILLQDVYVKGEDCLERSRILLRKGRAVRGNSDQGLSNSIQCTSEAISVLISGTAVQGSAVSHQLAMAHSLRALCMQETEPSSKEVIQDVEVAINLWLSIPPPDFHFKLDHGCSIIGDPIFMLCNIADLLAIKGFTEFNCNIFRLMIRFFEWRNVPIAKCLSFLWESRRFSHALCISPIEEAFLTDMSQNSEENFDTMEFWLHCLKASMPLLAGFQLKLSYSSSCSLSNHGSCSQLDVAVDSVKKATSELLSDGSMNSRSTFSAAVLYYDLCERLIASGQLVEAISYAKQAYRLHSKLFHDNFTYQGGNCAEKLDHSQKCAFAIQNIQVHKSIAIQLWSSGTTSKYLETCYLSPWKVLQCYLESTLQIAILHEMIGHGIEAQSFLLWGKEISCALNLPVFMVAFSSVLGKIYCEKRSWDRSEEELQNAKEILSRNAPVLSCSKCRLMLEVSVNQQLGDLTRSRLVSTTKDVSHELLSFAEGLYTSALDKLNEPEWKNPVSCPEKVEFVSENVVDCYAAICPEEISSLPSRAESEVKKRVRKSRQTGNAQITLSQENLPEVCHNTRLTRSRYHSSQKHTVDGCLGAQTGISQANESNGACGFAQPSGERGLLPEGKGCRIDYEGVCICNKMKCCNCLSLEVKEFGLVSQYIQMRWEFTRRRLSVEVLNGIGMCQGIRGQIHEEHKVSLQSLSVLLSRNPFRLTQISDPPTTLLNLMVKDFFRNTFAVQVVEVLYYICLFALKSYCIKGTRNVCCNFSRIKLPEAVHWLMEAFVLCREIPNLLKKVSTLLSAIYIISPSKGLFSLPSCNKVLSESHWASYFHQASLGTHLNYQFFLNKTKKIKLCRVTDEQDKSACSSTNTESHYLPRVAPASVDELENFVTEFFADLPNTAIMCISLISDPLTILLQEFLAYPRDIRAWLLSSRLNSNNQPLATLLPLYSSLEDDDSCYGEIAKSAGTSKKWHCPWGMTVIDEVAPVFRNILEANYLSSLTLPADSKVSRTLWWARRKRLDCQLDGFLRSLEERWFGPWRIVLSTRLSNSKEMDVVESKLTRDLKSKCKVNANQILLKVILGAGDELDVELCVKLLLSLKKGCIVGEPGLSEEGSFETKHKDSEAVKRQTELAVKLLHEALNKVKELKEQISVSREAAILVLDHEVQMLPWENIPTLRSQEVYRLPTVGSISWILGSLRDRESAGIISAFPSIDPLDAFYLLNPSGDLKDTQAAFEKWFNDKNFGGTAGSAPTSEELALALKNHDLFIYIGHGNGTQYISGGHVQKLEKCAATLLMGCSSGSLTLTGSYIPEGAPLYYLLAGSPVVVSNLWEVTDKDIDRFSKEMLDAWVQERSNAYTDSARCNLTKEFESMSIMGGGKGRKKVSKKASKPEDCDHDDSSNHRPMVGSFMAQAREACTLKYLIGAAPVCYGVPTSIRRKDTLN
ncbi:ESP1 [Linum perenne]